MKAERFNRVHPTFFYATFSPSSVCEKDPLCNGKHASVHAYTHLSVDGQCFDCILTQAFVSHRLFLQILNEKSFYFPQMEYLIHTG